MSRSPEARDDGIAIRAGGLFDGRTGHPGAVTVVARYGILTEVTDVDRVGDLPLLDFGPGSWLLPGLIDTHVHLVFDGSADPVTALAGRDDDEVLERMREAAAAHLDAGVTSVRDLGDRGFLSTRLAGQTRSDLAAGPHIVASGPPITTPGGHCHFLGGAVDGVEGLRAAVRERAARGCDVVKVMVSGGNLTPGSDPALSQFTRSELEVVVEEAGRLGLKVAAHTHGADAVADAVRAGVFSIEHVTFVTSDGSAPPDDLLDEVAASGVMVSASLGLRPELWAQVPPSDRAMVEHWFELNGELSRRGARMVVGSDAGIAPFKPHGVLPYAAGQLVHQLGFTPAEALTAITARAAEACGLASHKGSVRRGLDADLVVVDGDPLTDPAALLDLRAVFRGGKLVRSVRGPHVGATASTHPWPRPPRDGARGGRSR
ncbi:amidohydrolase family protein [Actinoplanes sp. TRM 88003]|uniref:Amidohydrolase family protein n=1 Tax=Paractinoplanes aksuensis TaxID=2939490 RepID=A0ABT1DXA3_9ACTN|nr:amidohydrolase family protein [Actinoplanes aksuensis]MCO8275489.1 amidohydrolase family protein [Actinoplanes aksuensis]